MSRHAIKSVSLLWLSSLGAMITAFFTQLIAARVMGPANYGVFSAALTTATIFVPFASFGTQLLWLQLFGEFGNRALPWLQISIRLVRVATAMICAGLLAWSLCGPHDEPSQHAIQFLLLYLVGQVVLEMITTKLQLEDRFVSLAAWQFFPFFVRLLLALAFVKFFPAYLDPVGLAAMYSLVSLVTILCAIPHLARISRGEILLGAHLEGNTSSISPDQPASAKNVLTRAWPLILSGVFYLVYFQGAVVMLGYLSTERATGIYAIAASVMAAVYLFPVAIFQKFLLPRIQRWAVHDPVSLNVVYKRGCRWMLVLGCVVAAAIWVSAPLAITLLYGNKYTESIEIVRLLCLCAPARFTTICIGSILSSEKLVRVKMTIMIVAALLCILGNYMLIPRFGAQGAAWSTLAVELSMLAMFKIYADRRILLDVGPRRSNEQNP